MNVETIVAFLEKFAPPRLAADWDNVGLLVGDRRAEVRRVMTCLTITPPVAAEAVELQADLIVTHHPLPFTAVNRLTTDTTVGRILLDLIAAHTAIYSPHTAFDSAAEGINQRLAAGLGLQDVVPLVPHDEGQGEGRIGRPAGSLTLGQLAARLKDFLGIQRLHVVGEEQQPVGLVAVACGAAGEFLEVARQMGCDAMVLGEARFHTCLEAEAVGIGLLLPGHYASERFAVERLAEVLAQQFAGLGEVWASRLERDPIQWLE